MPFLSSFPWVRGFALRFAIISVALVILAPLAACGGGGSSSSGMGATRHERIKLIEKEQRT